MKIFRNGFSLVLILLSIPVFAQVTSNPQVIFNMPLADDPGTAFGATHGENIRNAATLFGATAICLRVNWRDVEPTTRGTFVWTALDKALDSIVKSQNLNLCIRFSFLGGGRPAWTEPVTTTTTARPFNQQHFMTTESSATGLPDVNRAFAISSSTVRSVLNGSYTTFLNHVVARMNTYNPNRRDNILFLEPTISSSEEMIYPTDGLLNNLGVDYSDASIAGFQAFLQSRYGTVATLNQQWSTTGPGAPQTANFTSFTSINPRATSYSTVNYPSGGAGWNWHLDPGGATIQSNIANFNFFKGRRDWFLYRQQVLKTFFDGLASITHSKTLAGKPVPCAYRPGVITQNWGNQVSPMERQGWYDFTSLAENADWINVAPTFTQGGGLWEIEADFLRSVCKYWSWKKGGAAIRFSDESNWPDYPSSILPVTNRAAKNQADIDQTKAFLDRGASAHVVMGWESYLWDSVTLQNFEGFRNYLKGLASTNILTPSRSVAVHISSSRIASLMGRFFPTSDGNFVFNSATNRFDYTALNSRTPVEILPTKIVGGYPYIFNAYNTSNCDFITDGMINRDPTYINRYEEVYLPNGSRQIYNDVYNGKTLDNLLSRNVTIRLINAAWYHTGAPFPSERWASIPGTELFAGAPAPDVLRMIWRTSTSSMLTSDINRWQTIWPAGNSLTTNQSILSANGIPSNWYDFVQFAVISDQNSDFFENVDVSFGTWDKDATTMWQWSGFGDWRDGFGAWARSSWPDRYNCSGCSTVDNASTFLDWLKNTGAPADPTYIKWGYWPYSN